jgi:D-alanine-D-alanine ligase
VQYNATNAVVATDLPPEVRNRILMVGLEAAHVMQCNDYARVDIRLTPDGRPYVVEVNANPYLETTGAVAVAALQAGMSYKTLINRIVETARKRWQQTEPQIVQQQKSSTSKRVRRQKAKSKARTSTEKDAERVRVAAA